MMSFAGYFHVRFMLSAYYPVCFVMFAPAVFVSVLVWFGSIYLVIAAGFVADQLIM